MSPYYSLRVIRLERLSWKHPFPFHSKTPDLYVKIKLGDVEWKTQTVKKSTSPTWNEEFVIPPSDESFELIIEVKHNATLLPNRSVGLVSIELEDLLAECAESDGEVGLGILSPNGVERLPIGFIVVNLAIITSSEAVNMGIEAAQGDVQRRGFVRSTKAADLTRSINNWITGVSSEGDFYRALGDLLFRLDAFKKVVDALSGVHPIAAIAWTAVSGLYQLVDRTFQVDRKLLRLVSSMVDAFTFTRNIRTLRSKYLSLQGPVALLLKQTAECCSFVRHYAGLGFARRMVDSKSSGKIDEFLQTLSDLKHQIDSGITHETALVLVRTAGRIDTMYLKTHLDPSMFDAFDRSECLPETRVKIREQIMEWMFSKTSQNIFWLYGVAGSGKSTVSATIASHFKQVSRLGAFLFFVREKSEPSSVIRSIAYQLAQFDCAIGERILLEVDSDKGLGTGPWAHQFNKLLSGPLHSTADSLPGPIVVVLDALDECGTPESRRVLMNLLRSEFPKLPNNFRFLITSRRESDIDQLLSSQPEGIFAVELEHASDSSKKDVLSFLRAEMRVVLQGQVEIPKGWPWDENMESLGKAANGLFIWASTAVRMVRNSDAPFDRLECLVSDSKSVAGFGLNELYASVLSNSGIDWDNRKSCDRFRNVMSLVLLSKVPLSSEVIDGFLELSPQQSSSQVLSRLRSLVGYGPGGTASLLHASFADYLASPDRSGNPWSIDIRPAQQFIVEQCFAIMKSKLRFNICGLESSFVRNEDVPDLAEHIKSCIPPHLEYACLHWAEHLVEVPYSSEVSEMLTDWAYQHLLFWFEVLSLTKTFGRVAIQSLSEAFRWSELHDTSIASFLLDAKKLASMFATPVIQSTPHIYVSMIPFSEDDSKFAAHYSKLMSSKIRVERVGDKSPPLCLRVFELHDDGVNSVAFSPNGRHVASASDDGTVRMWGIESGEEVFEPLTGRTVCFSPDGSRIASGSEEGDLRVWDAQKGDLILGPLEGHSGWINSVAWSPDGMRIASGSVDKTIILWNAADRKPILRLSGHTGYVRSVAFSPDSSRLASGSYDTTIRIWDVKSGELASGPFEGHSDLVRSVAFSLDGKHVASGSIDETIKIWEVESGSVLLTLEGHIDWVMSVAYSPCGTRIVSGSEDETVRVWDAKSGELISTLEGHTDWVNSVAVSPDGRYIASGSEDMTVRIWDATITRNSKASTKHSSRIMSVASSPDGRRIASASYDKSIIVWDARTGDAELTLHGHTKSVKCVAFVPNGSQLVSGSWDKTVRIWDTETGESASEPLMHTYAVMHIAVSPDSSTLACGTLDNTISVWSIATGQLVAGPLQGHSRSVSSIAFSPSGKRLASGSHDETIIIWDTDCWEAIQEPLTGHSAPVVSVCFSSDGSRIASGSWDDTIIVWDAENGQKVAGPFEGHANSVSSIVFSLDGRHLIAGSRDHTIRVWDAQSGRTTCELRGHTARVTSLALSPDGCRIISGSYDKTIRVWDLSDVLQPQGEHTGDVETLFSEWDLGENGWVLGGQDRRDLLAWIPPDLRGTLWRPRNTAVLGCDYLTKLDFTGVALGERWAECFVSSSGSGS